MGIRTVLNDKDDPLSPRVKEAQNLKIPYVFIIGHAEQEKGTVSLRLRHNKKLNDVDLDEAINMVLINIKNKD
jgi:threonyl-tRNA synthetase